jgi:hypothetical protein
MRHRKQVAGKRNCRPHEKHNNITVELHYFISWPAGAFERSPVDIIERTFAPAGFAMPSSSTDLQCKFAEGDTVKIDADTHKFIFTKV